MENDNERPIDRIKQVADWLTEKKIVKSVNAFERVCGLSHLYIRNLSATEKGNPGMDVAAKIYAAFPSLNLEWLVTGKGKMWKKKEDDALINKIKSDIINKLILI